MTDDPAHRKWKSSAERASKNLSRTELRKSQLELPGQRKKVLLPEQDWPTTLYVPLSLWFCTVVDKSQFLKEPPTMTLFILTETSAGYALLKAKDKKLLKRDDISSQAETAEGACEM